MDIAEELREEVNGKSDEYTEGFIEGINKGLEILRRESGLGSLGRAGKFLQEVNE